MRVDRERPMSLEENSPTDSRSPTAAYENAAGVTAVNGKHRGRLLREQAHALQRAISSSYLALQDSCSVVEHRCERWMLLAHGRRQDGKSLLHEGRGTVEVPLRERSRRFRKQPEFGNNVSVSPFVFRCQSRIQFRQTSKTW